MSVGILAGLRRGYQAPARAAAPIVKWAGGKTRLLPELLARMPSKFFRYYEPFAGGAALFFRVAPRDAHLNDFNEDLVATYTAVRDHVEDVILHLRELQVAHSAEFYVEMRDAWNESHTTSELVPRAAAFIYLNKTCFNGLWRVNRDGLFNVPSGKYANPTICNPEALRAASEALHRVTLTSGSYERAIESATRGDFVYFDPPYDPLTKTSNFTAYAAGGFGDDDQHELARRFAMLAHRGVRVMLSNSDTPFVRELYKDFVVDSVTCARAINSNGAKRGAVGEVIVTAGY